MISVAAFELMGQTLKGNPTPARSHMISRAKLRAKGWDLVCPHRKGRKRTKTQDGRKLRRYRRRWKIERTVAWLPHRGQWRTNSSSIRSEGVQQL